MAMSKRKSHWTERPEKVALNLLRIEDPCVTIVFYLDMSRVKFSMPRMSSVVIIGKLPLEGNTLSRTL